MGGDSLAMHVEDRESSGEKMLNQGREWIVVALGGEWKKLQGKKRRDGALRFMVVIGNL